MDINELEMNINQAISKKVIFDMNSERAKKRLAQMQKRKEYLNETDSIKNDKSTFSLNETSVQIEESTPTQLSNKNNNQNTELNQNNINNNQNMNNYLKIKNNIINKNSNSIILKIKLDKDNYENMEINLDEEPDIFVQALKKKTNMNENLMLFLYKKVKDLSEKMEKIFKAPLKSNTLEDLKKINNVLNNKDLKENNNNLNENELIKIDNNILLRNNSFNSLNSIKHKNFINKFLYSLEENKKSEKLNISN